MKNIRFSSIRYIVLHLAIALTLQGIAAEKKPLVSSLPGITSLPKGVSLYQLDNGVQVLLIENPALPVIGANVIVKIGSAYESFSTSGASHMLEHLLFNGTTSRSQKQLYDDVDRVGGYNNATTSDFFTNYMFVVPVENAKKGLQIQADMLFNSTLPVEKFQKEKRIVLEEISKSIADPNEQLERNTISLLHNSHALSLPTLGTYSTIESLNRDDVYSFYKNNYVPNNMILTIIGNFQTASLLPLIKEIYGKVSPGQVIRAENPEWKTGFQTTNGETFEGKVFNRFYDGKEKIVQLFFPLPARKTSEYFHLVNVVLDKEKDGILFSLKSQFSFVNTIDLSTRTSHLGNYLEARISGKVEGDYDAAAKLLTAKLSKISFALSPETVASEAIKKRTDFVKNIEKPHMFGIYYSASLVHGGIESLLSSFSGGGYFPAAKELESLALKNYQFIIVQSPSVKNEKEQIGVSTVTKIYNDSASGKNLIVVQNEANNLLAIHYLIKHKAALESKYGKDAAKIVHNALEQRLNADTNKKVSSKYGFAFTVNDNPFIPMDDIYLHPDFGYIRVEGLADDVAGAIQFLNSHLQGFIPTEEEYKKAVEKFKAISFALAGGDKGKKLFEETYKSVVYAANPYSQLQPALTYENTVAFAKEYLKPSNIVISIVSPAKTDSVDNAFSKLGFSKLDNEPDVFTPTIMLSDKPVTIEKQHGGERSYLFWGFTQKIDVKDAPALLALSLILNDQIVFDIREKQGLAYNISAGIEVIGDKALFYINQGTRPMNVDTLVAQYPRFFKESVLDSLTQDQLEKSINQYLGRIMFRRLSSINKAFYLGNSLYINNDYEYDKKFLDGLRKVTLSDVKTVGKKYLNITNPISVIIR